ncbi:Heparan-sulfate 6-O-sulfotransferase 1-A [Fragariocoptes setiger]|uniref:Heparan-sulfate 6-O-sulfotransferase n=1 Tax=Fragariocoptes setiger TaxID=1670756 RepID=A0ABQ7SDD4_9ACAR|nr:Heparan-sulfate 6-O-sulfotransferase 1-A [Fragariocoptes setiger]
MMAMMINQENALQLQFQQLSTHLYHTMCGATPLQHQNQHQHQQHQHQQQQVDYNDYDYNALALHDPDSVTYHIAQQIEFALRQAKQANCLNCCQVSIPCNLTYAIAQDILQMSETEPCGLRGCTLFINLEEKDSCQRIASFKFGDCYTVATFEMFLTLKRVPTSWLNNVSNRILKNFGRNSIGKQGTKGQKAIYDENLATIKFYTLTSAGACCLHIPLSILFFYDSSPLGSWTSLIMTLLAISVYIGSIYMMHFMAKPVFAPGTNTVVDGGIDLNMNSGFAEHLKDLLILTSFVQILSIFSNYFWLLWLIVPGRATQMLWSNIIAPWIFAPAPEVDKEAADKKQLHLLNATTVYSTPTTPPASSSCFLRASASSLDTLARITLGHSSTKRFASTKFMPSMIFLISLMSVTFLASSNFCNLTIDDIDMSTLKQTHSHARIRILTKIWYEFIKGRSKRLIVFYMFMLIFFMSVLFSCTISNYDADDQSTLSGDPLISGFKWNYTNSGRQGDVARSAKIKLSSPNEPYPPRIVSYTDLINTTSFDISGHDTVVFLHIQKTGGTTFGKHLVKDLILEKPCKCEIDLKKCHCIRPNSTPQSEFWLISRFTTGWKCGIHADWTELTECLNKEANNSQSLAIARPRYLYVTFLRHPIRRFVSEFEHVQRGATWRNSRHLCNGRPATYEQLPPCYDSNDWRGVSMDEFLSCKSNLAVNRQTRMLANLSLVGCYNSTGISEDLRDQIMLQSAKDNLRNLSFFGLCEYQVMSQFLFEKKFGLKFKRPFTQSNETRTSQALGELSPEIIGVIKKLNHLDIQLYDYATKLFINRYKSLQPQDQLDFKSGYSY